VKTIKGYNLGGYNVGIIDGGIYDAVEMFSGGMTCISNLTTIGSGIRVI
jgi:hypothetical protein